MAGKFAIVRHARQHARRARYLSRPSHAAYFDILLNRETFSARAVRYGVRVGDFKTAFLQVFAVIEH
jgi:hypothetical protein